MKLRNITSKHAPKIIENVTLQQQQQQKLVHACSWQCYT